MFSFLMACIGINSGAEKWGPFGFDLTGAIPPGDSLQSATITSAIASMSAQDISPVLPSGTDTTSALINSSSINGNVVEVWLNFPGDTLVGSHTISLQATFASGAQNRYDFGYVVVSL